MGGQRREVVALELAKISHKIHYLRLDQHIIAPPNTLNNKKTYSSGFFPQHSSPNIASCDKQVRTTTTTQGTASTRTPDRIFLNSARTTAR